MNQFIKSICAGWVVCLAFFFSADAHAQFFMGHDKDREEMKEKMEQRIQHIYDQLGLSEEQKKLLQDNKNKHKTAAENFSRDLKATMQAMGEELKAKDLDMDKINAIHARIKDLRGQMADERFNAILEVRKILTQEQFTKFIELIEQQKDPKPGS